jgi:putative heme-binding domain-containing protein
MDLTKLPDKKLVEMHLHANEWYVRQARRLLQERALAGRILPASLAGLRKILDKNPDVSRRLRALWTLHLVGGLGDVMLAPLLDDKEEYIRAWAIQLIAEDKRVPDAVLQKWATMAKEDKSAAVRLFLASAMQRVEPAQRAAVLEALVAHEEDKNDHNLPLLIWYALEPLVVLDEAKTARIEAACKMDKVKGFIARRRKAGGKTTSLAPAAPKRVNAKPARAEESAPELFAHYREVLSPGNLAKADLIHGQAVFSKSCGQCHMVKGKGGTAGPSLSSKELGNLEYLLPHVLDPDGEIDEKYRYYKFELKDERIVLGVIAGESKESYILESTAGRFELEKNTIAHRDTLPYSLMPDAVFQTLTDTEVRDLVAFLREE